MPVRATVTYVNDPEIQLRAFKRIVKESMQIAVKHWHRYYLRRHFKRDARRRYGYKPRSKKYNDRKERLFGHRLPLVFTGRLKREALRQVRISGNSKRAKAVLSVPKYMYAYKPGQPDKADEITRVTEDEAKMLAVLLDQHIQRKLVSARKHYRKKRIR